MLHDAYRERIKLEIDELDALQTLIPETDNARTPVIGAETRESLIEYLGFRHVVRHTGCMRRFPV